MGFLLYPHHSSLRKSLSQVPKFYFFDPGVQRALAETLDSRLSPRTSAFGEAFEAFVILEVCRHNSYSRANYTLEYFSDGSHEIDLVLSAGRDLVAVEVKSTEQLRDSDVEKFARLADSLGVTRKLLLSQDRIERIHHGVECWPWQVGLLALFPRHA